MKKMTMAKRASFIMIALLLLMPNVLSIGIAPARKILDYNPSQVEEVTLKIINNEHKDFKALITIRGELENLTTIRNNLVTIAASEDIKEFKFNIRMPSTPGKPGVRTSDVVALEVSEGGDGSTVNAVGAVISELGIRFPFPDKYIESELVIPGVSLTEPVTFIMPVYNYGKEDIDSIKARIEIFGATYEKIAELESDIMSLKVREEGKIKALWKHDVNPGTYKAVASIIYDGKVLKLEKTFHIGVSEIEIEGINVPKFTLGEIAQFDIMVENKWNERIDDVYADITISDKAKNIEGQSRTATIDIEPFTKGVLNAYWNTKNVEVGPYDVLVKLYYNNKKTEKLFEIDVNLDSIRTTDIAARVIDVERGTMRRDSIIMIALIFLVLINIGWFVYMRKKSK